MPKTQSFPILDFIHRIVASWRFPLVILYFLFFYTALMLSVLLFPQSESAWGQFADSFKTWCLGYDPATGEMETAFVVMMLVNPIVLSFLIWVVWNKQLKQAWQNKTTFIAYGTVCFALMATLGSCMFLLDQGRVSGELPFPAEELRTASNAPTFTFTNQENKPVSLKDFAGQVVLLTGVYATCGNTCPMIMGQAKRAVARLSEEEQSRFQFVGITLDPERDTPEILAAMAAGQQVTTPLFHLVTGASQQVNDVLDHLNIARRRDPETGIIDHTNLFILLDKKGKIAYRFSLGERQEEWLVKAMKLLLAEKQDVS